MSGTWALTACAPASVDTDVVDPEPSAVEVEAIELGVEWRVQPTEGLDAYTRMDALAFGAGRWWALMDVPSGVGSDLVSPHGRPVLVVSDDAVQWSEVDLSVQGLPDEIPGDAVLVTTDDDVTVVFANAVTQPLTTNDRSAPWVVRGDGSSWSVLRPEAFGAWSVEGSRANFSYIGTGPLAHRGDDSLMLALGQWWNPPPGGPNNRASIIFDSSTGSMSSRDGVGPGSARGENLSALLVSGDQWVALGSVSRDPNSAGAGIDVAVWSSADGREWQRDHPDVNGAEGYTVVYDAVAGPAGIVAVGAEQTSRSTVGAREATPVVLHSVDGQQWSRIELEGERALGFVVSTPHGYFAFHDPSNSSAVFQVVWRSEDGVVWNEVSREIGVLINDVQVAASSSAIVISNQGRVAISGVTD
ncbi:MAG: hypothetical protein KIT89_01235 [Microcella sp.]|uniref:hypothetical protein n=1 Tax=Microcella sp. TaxID=1913979 RepID=UPI0024C85BAA|nr:hypothetical protein [Microcella sp.]UYN83891.1 MAG: hypothetical protein KIT89_01235 [Microcella sp.]